MDDDREKHVARDMLDRNWDNWRKVDTTNESCDVLSEEVYKRAKITRPGGVDGNGNRKRIDGYTAREDLGRSIEELGDGGANENAMNTNSGEEDEGVVYVVLSKKRRARPSGSGKNKVSAPKKSRRKKWKSV